MNKFILFTRSAAFLCSVFLIASCGEEKTKEVSNDNSSENSKDHETNGTGKAETVVDAITTLQAGEASSTVDQPFSYTKPASWTEKGSSMFRTINMALEPEGEVYLSVVGGDLLMNINRWHRQFGGEEVTLEAVKAGEKVSILGTEGYLVEGRGDYQASMKKDQMLLGVITQQGGRIITVKMIAPPEVAEREKQNLKDFCKSLKRN